MADTHFPFQLLSTKQAEMITGHSRRTLSRWVRAGKLTPVRLSRKVMYPESELQRLIAASTQPERAVA